MTEPTRTDSHRTSPADDHGALERLDVALDGAGVRGRAVAVEEAAADAELVRLHALLALPPVRVPASFADAVMARVAEEKIPAELADRPSVRLLSLLRLPPVAVPATFADGVMARVRAEDASRRRSRMVSLVAAALGAVALLVGTWWAGGPESPDSILGTLGSALASSAVAGAGLVAATWRGVGGTVGSWIGASPTTGGILALLFLASAVLLLRTLRRARQGADHRSS